MVPREQLRVISSILPRLIHEYGEQSDTLHYSASAADERTNPAMMPEEI